ncbi:MAG TPA: hypothetical protein VIN06_13545 [Devosia sp.]
MRLDQAELDATVARMEARYAEADLFPVYLALVQRFSADLDDPRDLALSKAAALMLIKFAEERK